MEVIVSGVAEAKAFFNAVRERIASELPTLFRSLGDVLVADVKQRIITSDGGAWAPASKWLRAKSGQSKVLLGMEKYVRFRLSRGNLKILGKGGLWTLTQHHEGFVNQLAGASEKFDIDGRVLIPIKDAEPLGLYAEMRRGRMGGQRAQVFAFVPKRAGRTPARKVWTGGEEAAAMCQPIASRWLERIVEDAKAAMA